MLKKSHSMAEWTECFRSRPEPGSLTGEGLGSITFRTDALLWVLPKTLLFSPEDVQTKRHHPRVLPVAGQVEVLSNYQT